MLLTWWAAVFGLMNQLGSNLRVGQPSFDQGEHVALLPMCPEPAVNLP
jgi:hypothetical protein